MFYLIYQLRDTLFDPESPLYKFCNVLRYTTPRAGAACVIAFLFTLLFGKRVIHILQALKLGQPIRGAEEVHRLAELHGNKSGTPTMGGILIIASVLVASILFCKMTSPFVWAVLSVTLILGFLGFLDDYTKVRAKNSEGISARTKLIGQCAVALGVGIFLSFNQSTGEYIRTLWIPYMKSPLIADLGFFTPVLFLLVIVGCSNAVNLTDGLDGLAAGCSLTVAATYGLIAHLTSHALIARDYLFIPHHPEAGELAIICFAFMGAAMGFLWFNCHPAQIFMGDTGSLAIGGMLGTIAMCLNQELLLIIVGGVFVMEALSVILQVGSFKLRGKRIFRMAPIHHHFELKGWKESQVIARFWILSILFALIGLATLKVR